MVIEMENPRKCENRRGMGASKATVGQHGFSRATSTVNHYFCEAKSPSLPEQGNEVYANQFKQANHEQWCHRITENLRHDMCR
jgi:hypothetical protein